ncbi:MAG: outer membrane protein [Sphingobium sp.]
MKSVFVVAAVSAVVAIAAPASARDFNGGYVGVAATLDNIQGSGDAEGIGFSGVGVSGFAGYDVPVSANVFVGVEGNVDVYTADEDNLLDTKAKWGWGVSGRLGTKVNDSTGLYARVGYARAKGTDVFGKYWLDGVRYGAGVETRVTDSLSLRAEFSQFNFEQSLINNQGTIGVVFGF